MRVTRTRRSRLAPCLALLGEVLLNPISDAEPAIVSVKALRMGRPTEADDPWARLTGSRSSAHRL
jgi:hypothetical protein